MNLLLVDDEKVWLNSMAETIPWHTAGIGSVYTAASGHEALTILKDTHIDIMVTDIRMPEMSGLELIEEASKYDSRIKSIVLSGYADFDYAKQALYLKAAQYVLKPPRDEDLLAAVKELCDQIREEWKEISSYRKAVQALREKLPLLRDNLLNQLIQGKKIVPQELTDHLEMYGIPFAIGDTVSLMLLRLEGSAAGYGQEHRHLIEYAVCNIAEETLKDEFTLWQCKSPHDYLLFMIKMNNRTPGRLTPEYRNRSYERLALQLQKNCKYYIKQQISILKSPWGAFPAEVPHMYELSLSSFVHRIGDERELLIEVSGKLESKKVKSIKTLYEPPTMRELLETGRWHAIDDKLSAIFEELQQQWCESREHIIETFFELWGSFSYIAHKNGGLLADLLPEQDSRFLSGGHFHTVEQLQQWAGRALTAIRSSFNDESQKERTRLAAKVKAYIEAHLHEDPNLQVLADHVYLNHSYLSRMFKLETGESISDYLLRLRMDKAVYMLRNKELKIQDIASALGYQYTQYFIKVFKKQFGMTPQEYKDSINN